MGRIFVQQKCLSFLPGGLLLVSSLLLLAACGGSISTGKTSLAEQLTVLHGNDSARSNDPRFYADSVFNGHYQLLTCQIKKYDTAGCSPFLKKVSQYRNELGHFSALGDINGNGMKDSVFMLWPLTNCEEGYGKSYYFTDTTLPRLTSGTYCSTLDGFFIAPDIDEDGVHEVGFYYSGCVSRYKSLLLYQLKDHAWLEIAVGEFDIMTQDPGQVNFADLIEKIERNKFRIRNFLEGRQYWDTIILR